MNLPNAEATVNKLVTFLRVSFQKAKFTTAVLGLSGGVDSATSCGLSVRALGADNVHVALMPHGNLNKSGTEDGLTVASAFGIPQKNTHVVNILPMTKPFLEMDKAMNNVRQGNIMARVRMIVLFDLAKKLNALVVGTENKSEHYLGYYTRFGDEASDIEPLRNLYKSQVYQLAKHLGVPESILTKAPTAGLWEGQTDEGEFGFSYKEADIVLSLVVEGKRPAEEAVKAGVSGEVVRSVLERVKINQFKLNLPQIPPTD